MSIKLKGSSDGSVSFDAPADTSPSGSDITLTLPTSAGSADQFLKNSGIAGELEYSSMVETSTGVGIGETNPATKLHLKLDTDKHIRFQGNIGEIGSVPGFQGVTDAGGLTGLGMRGNDLRFATGSAERMRLDSSGQLLIGASSARTNFNNGTASPQVQIENVSNGNKSSIALIHNENATSDSSALNFAKTRGGSVGDNSALNQAGDRLGTITFQGNDGTEFVQAASIQGLTDASPGANDMPGRLVFSTTADGDTSPQERMRIDKDGKLFVKNSFSDSARNVVIQIECSGQGRGRILSGNSDTDPATLGASSDRRLKTNIRNYTGGLERIKQIPVKIYDEVNTSATDVISWVADEVAPIFPEAVIGEANAVDADGNPEYQTLSSLKFFPDLVQCVQTLIAKIETLETQNTAQQAQIDDLLARVTALEAA